MRGWIILGRLLLCAVLVCVSGLSQEPYEARAARLQPEDIPPLIQKAQDGDLSSQVLLWLAYSGGYGVRKDVQRGLPWLRKAAEQGSLESQWVLSTFTASSSSFWRRPLRDRLKREEANRHYFRECRRGRIRCLWSRY
jgi:TPR repeat protein